MSTEITGDDIYDDELLIEAARYAVKIGCERNRFMSLAKKAWFQAMIEQGRGDKLPPLILTVGRKEGRKTSRRAPPRSASHNSAPRH